MGIALYSTGKINLPTQKAFMNQWGDIFGVAMHDYGQTLSKLTARKKSITPFLESLVTAFELITQEKD